METNKEKQRKTTIAISNDVKKVLDEFKSLTFSRSYDDVIRFLIKVYVSYEESIVREMVKNFVCSRFEKGSAINYHAYIRLVVDNIINKIKNPLLAIRESRIVIEAMKYVKPLPEEGMVTVDTSLCREE